MSNYTATIHWTNVDDGFLTNSYSRAHAWTFDGGLTVPASASPQIVPEPMSVPANVDPEEAFVASISSCHMLWFLSLAADDGLSIHSYTDNAVGTLGSNSKRQIAMLKVELTPQVTLADGTPLDAETASRLHEQAHRHCFIANSVSTEIVINSGKGT
jgi:organic hydroperoxide reductase OsmC/OhrA